MALILTAAVSQTTFAAASDGNQFSSVYLQLKGSAEARQEELLYLLDEELSPEVMTSLQTAIQLMQQAENVAADDPQASMQYYLDALKGFRETWAQYLDTNEDVSANTLKQTTENDSPPEIIMDDEFESEVKENKVRLLEKFQERIEEKYSSLYSEIEEMVEVLSDEDSNTVQKTFKNAQEKLGKIREKFQKGDIDDAIDSLDSDLVSFEDDLEYLNDKNALKTIKQIQQMDEQAHKVKIEKEKKAENGEDTEEEDVAINEIKKDIKEIKDQFKNDKDKTNGNGPDKKSEPTSDAETTDEPTGDTQLEDEEPSNETSENKKDDKSKTDEGADTGNNSSNDNQSNENGNNNSNNNHQQDKDNGNNSNSSHGNSSNAQDKQNNNKKTK